MAKQILNVGTNNNDKTGDTLRAGGLKIKANFDEIYAALASNGINISGGNVLKTGDYQDLSNKPVFATVATSGDFYDLTDRPDLGIFVGAPANDMGSDGHVAGNMAFDNNFLYVCKEDYVQQDQFTGFAGVTDTARTVVYTLVAASASSGTTVTLIKNVSLHIPQVGWEISNGTITRCITAVNLSGDNIILTLDGAFPASTSIAYSIIYTVTAGQYVLRVNWNATTYQDLMDQYVVDEKPAKLFISADGYGRVVNDLILNSTTQKLYIVYTAGSAIGAFTGLTFRFNQPSIWESIPWTTVFGEDDGGGGGGGSTGAWTWEDDEATQALLGGESGSYIDGQSPGGLLIHNDNIVTLQAGDKGLSYDDTGVLQFQEGSTIGETPTTLVLTPPTALTGQGLVIRTTVGGGLSTTDTFTPGSPVTITFTDSGSHLSTGGYVDGSESNTWAYTITGISEADLGSPLTGSFLAENWGTPHINQNAITFNIPAESEGTGFTITLDKIITEPPYYLSGIGGINEDGRIYLDVGEVITTEVSHVHLTTADPTTVDLYLGDDNQYVKIEKDGGDVVIGTNTNTHRWRFDTNGALTFPTLSTDIHNGGIQTAQTLQFANPSLQAIITGPTPEPDTNAQRLIIQGQRGLGTGEGGDVYLWGGDAEGTNGGDIKIYAGDADDVTTGYGGYVNLEAGYGFTRGGNVEIKGGDSATVGGDLQLEAGYGPTSGSVNVRTNGYQWEFDQLGVMYLPLVRTYAAVTYTSVPVTYGATELTFTVTPDNTITNMSVAVGAGGYGADNQELTVSGTLFPGGTSPANDITFNVTTFAVPDFPSETTTSSVVTYVSGTLPAKYDNIRNAGNVGIGAGSQHWVFGADGALTFPDATTQTTGIAQGQYLLLLDGTNTMTYITDVNFNLLLATPAIGYMGNDTHVVQIANGAPGQRFVIVNNSTQCIVEIAPHTIPPMGRAEFVFTSGTYGDGWVPLYGTAI